MLNANQIDLNLLVVFNEIYQFQHISIVAKRLQLSQPAVSNALARLRTTFNDPLFVRTKQGMQPTPYAEQLSEPIRAALTSITNAINPPENFVPSTSQRQFTLALTDVAEVYFMPRLIAHCMRFAPQITIKTSRIDGNEGDEWMDDLGSGKLDFALGAFINVSEALYQRRLFNQQFVVLMRAAHPKAPTPLTAQDLLIYPHIQVANKTSPYDDINRTLEKAGVFKNNKISVPHFTAVPYIVSQHDLLATVPQKLAQSTALPFNLTYQNHPLTLPSLQTHIFWHKRFHQDAGNIWMRTVIGEVFGNEG